MVAYASPTKVTIYQTSPILGGLLWTSQGETTLQVVPGGSDGSPSLIDGQGNVQGSLRNGQVTLTNPSALTFDSPPGVAAAPVAPAPTVAPGTGTTTAAIPAGAQVKARASERYGVLS